MPHFQQLEAINDMLRELEDVKNSQVSLLKKVTEMESDSNPVTGNFLQKEITIVHDQANDNFINLTRLIKELQTHRSSFLRSYNLEAV